MKGLVIIDTNLEVFPRNVEEFFQNLESLSISSSQITKISKEDLQNYPKLKVLLLFGNKIKHVYNNAFANNPGLKGISLNANPVRNVAANVLDHLSDLIYLGFNTACMPLCSLRRKQSNSSNRIELSIRSFLSTHI